MPAISGGLGPRATLEEDRIPQAVRNNPRIALSGLETVMTVPFWRTPTSKGLEPGHQFVT